MAFQTEITPLGNTASFRDWFNQYNNDVLSKINLAQIAFPNAGDGITFSSSVGGGYTFALSGTVTKQMTFQNSVVFQGGVSLGNSELSGLVYGVSGDYTSAGVTLGKVVRLTNTGGLTLAQADSPQNAEVIGIAISVSTARTLVALAGNISGSSIANNLVSGGFTSGCVYFLDPVNAGGITRTEPTLFGQVSKPMILGVGANEGIILPYRGQYINGICGGSGDNIFNSAVFLSVQSRGESASDFGLRPGKLVAIETGKSTSDYSSTVDTSRYSMATNQTPVEKIIGISTEYIGPYSEVNGTPVGIKVNTIGSVVTNISNYTEWTPVTPGQVVYLDESGNPTNDSSISPKLSIGVVADGNFVYNPITANQVITSTVGGAASSENMLINGSLSLWQRSKGVTTGYGITAGVSGNKQYLADKWIMWGVSGENGYTGERQNFSLTQTEVPGYPIHYVRLIKNTVPSGPAYFYNVLDDVRTIANKQLTLSFYARTIGGTGAFAIHSIQNIQSGSGNTYINGTTHSVETATTNWVRYAKTFIGPEANSGITNSYSLLGVRLDDNGKTYEFAQFMLQEGGTASVPPIVDIDKEYLKMAPYYQRSYKPTTITGKKASPVEQNPENGQVFPFSLNTNDDAGVISTLSPPLNNIEYFFPIRMKKLPLVDVYSVSGRKNEINIAFIGGYYDISSNRLTPQAGPLGTALPCSRVAVPNIPGLEIPLMGVAPQSEKSVRINPSFNTCPFDTVMFHYAADADTTIN